LELLSSFVLKLPTELTPGATENAGVENAILAKMQGWKMHEWKMRE